MITQPGEQPCLSSLYREPPTNQDLSSALHRAHEEGPRAGSWWERLVPKWKVKSQDLSHRRGDHQGSEGHGADLPVPNRKASQS